MPPGGNYNDITKRVTLEAAEPFILSAIKGVGGVESDIISSEVVGKDGRIYQGRHKRPREIECTVNVKGSTRAEMYRRRMELIGLLTADDVPGTAYYQNDYIIVKCPAVPVLPPDFSKRIQNYNESGIRLWCPDPDWISLENKTASIAWDSNSGFRLPFRFPISFSHLKNEVVIDYKGTARSPVVITITGPAENPSIVNHTTNKTIALNDRYLTEDEQLVITTERGKKSVELQKNGRITDAFQYVDPLSEFWELIPGKNVIAYYSDNNLEATSITVEYAERFAGV